MDEGERELLEPTNTKKEEKDIVQEDDVAKLFSAWKNASVAPPKEVALDTIKNGMWLASHRHQQ